MVYYFCHCMSVHECPGESFNLDSPVWPIFERNCPSGFLLVVFSLWCRYFKYVLLSFWCLGRRVLGNCIDS